MIVYNEIKKKQKFIDIIKYNKNILLKLSDEIIDV